MIKIAVCDDDIFYIKQIEELIKKCPPKEVEYEVKTYLSGEEFLSEIDSNATIDIAFMDIEMQEINGIDTVRVLKTRQPTVIVFFVTSHSCYVTDIFRLGTFQFLQKPINEQDFILDFGRAVNQYKRSHTKLEIRCKDKVMNFEYSDILYIEVKNKLITIATKKQKVEFLGKIKDYEKKLIGFGFINCHKSILINLQHIEKIDNSSVTLYECSETLPMSRNYKAVLLNEFSKYNRGKSL